MPVAGNDQHDVFLDSYLFRRARMGSSTFNAIGVTIVEMIRKNSSRKNMMSLSEAVYTSAIPVLRLSIFIALRAITVEHPRTADRPDSLQSLVHRHIHLQHDLVDPAVQQ